jgi:hypothetical protein
MFCLSDNDIKTQTSLDQKRSAPWFDTERFDKIRNGSVDVRLHFLSFLIRTITVGKGISPFQRIHDTLANFHCQCGITPRPKDIK